MGLYNPSVSLAASTININSALTTESTLSKDVKFVVALESTTTRKIIMTNVGENDVQIYLGEIQQGVIQLPAFTIKSGGTFIDEYPAFQGKYHAVAVGGDSKLNVTTISEDN